MKRTLVLRTNHVLALAFVCASVACSENAGTSGTAPQKLQPSANSNPQNAPATPTRTARLYEGRVEQVVDGDTIVVSGVGKVRYIGIDTPETVHPRKPVEYFGHEASAANRKLVDGKVVALEYDVGRTDRYGRTLAYVWVGDVMVNAWLVENGYAQVSTYPPNVRHTDKFLALQQTARAEGRGLWGSATAAPVPGISTPSSPSVPRAPPSTEQVYVTATGSKYHRSGCGYLRKSRTIGRWRLNGLTPHEPSGYARSHPGDSPRVR